MLLVRALVSMVAQLVESVCSVRDPDSIPGWGRFFGEGNGNPLQCSCLENLRDGGASWAAVYGVAQSRTRLKRLSSSSRAARTYTGLEKQTLNRAQTKPCLHQDTGERSSDPTRD